MTESPQAVESFTQERLQKSIVKNLNPTFNTFEEFKKELSKEYAFATDKNKGLSQSKLESLYYLPGIQKLREKSPQFKQDTKQKIDKLTQTIIRRNPTINKRKAKAQATAKIEETLDIRQARRKIRGEQRYGQPVRQWQRNKAQEPFFRPEQYIRQKSRKGNYYNRVKQQRWTTKQTNFIRANQKLPYLELAEKYNNTFKKTKRPIRSIQNKKYRLKS